MSNEEFQEKIKTLHQEFEPIKIKARQKIYGFMAFAVLAFLVSFYFGVTYFVVIGLVGLFHFLGVQEAYNSIEVVNKKIKGEVIMPAISSLLPGATFYPQKWQGAKATIDTHFFRHSMTPSRLRGDSLIFYKNDQYSIQISDINRMYNNYTRSVFYTATFKNINFPAAITIRPKSTGVYQNDEYRDFAGVYFRKAVRPFVEVKNKLFDEKFFITSSQIKKVDLKTAQQLADIANLLYRQIPKDNFLFLSVNKNKLNILVYGYPMNSMGFHSTIKNQDFTGFLNLTSSIKTHVDDLIVCLEQ